MRYGTRTNGGVITVRKNEPPPSEELRQKLTGKWEFQFPIGDLAIGEHSLDMMDRGQNRQLQ